MGGRAFQLLGSVKEPPARASARACLQVRQVALFTATDQGPGSRLGSGVPEDAPSFRSLVFSSRLRHNAYCPALTVQSRSPSGETGAYLTAHSDPASSGGSAETPGITALRRPANSLASEAARSCPLTRQQGGAATTCAGVANPNVCLAKGGNSRSSCPSRCHKTFRQ